MLRLLLLFAFLMTPVTSYAAEKLNFSTFSSLPILHEGRVKPLDSFARVMLKTFSGTEKLAGQKAHEWLAESLFDPASAIEKPLFRIYEAHKLGLVENKSRLYSYIDLSHVIQSQKENIKTLLETPEENWTEEQQTLIKLHDNFIIYTQILRSLTLVLPLNINGVDKSFIDTQKSQKNIEEKIRKIITLKGTNIEKYTEEEKELAALSYQLKILEEGSKNNVILRIIPQNWDNKKSQWQSPWATLQQENTPAKSLEYIDIWRDIADAYRSHNITLWEKETKNATAFFDNPKLKTELFYNKFHLIQVTEIFYIAAFALILLASFYPRPKIAKTALGVMIFGLITHAVHIALRVYILDRPPVGTLYESILFVSFISVAGFAYLAHKQKTSTGTLLGSLCGIILLITAQGFTSEDTMATLVAVLNTNFWLGTHVLCISIGYALCLITSFMAHYYLAQKYFKSASDIFPALLRNIKTLAIISLLFTTIGTILGGIWADQSWGRFWGWDPKENGALLIVLWLIWLLHGRISQHINDTGFVVGCAFLSIVVVLAWFGVNLLNVGLHSYGFITGVAMGIGIFCMAETVIISGLWLLNKKRPPHEN